MLNGDWISDVESRQAEIERGRPLEYFRSQTRGSKKGKVGASRKANNTARENGIKVNERRFDGSRMTVEQMLRNEARSTAIPLPQVLKHYQIDTESCEEVHEASDDLPEFTATTITLQNMERSDEVDDEHALMQQLFRPTTWQSQPLSADTDETKGEAEPDVKRPSGSSETEPWNYPISTFDDLQSEERQYVRYKSKHVGGTLERDDHFFESTTFLDCVAQCERSRRLTIRAVDLLTQPHSTTEISSELFPSRSTPYLPLSEAAATLTNNLTSNFTKQHARESFQRLVTLGVLFAEVGDYLFGEHIALRQKTNHQLSGQAANEIRWRDNAHGIEASLEESLSKVKLRNAVDLANTLDGGKEQKRHIQALIDADAKVIEEERVMEEHKSHRQRLRRINARQVVKPPARRDVELAKKLASLHEESPWQERNWKAKMKLLERMQEDGEPPATSSRRAKRILPTRSKPQLKSTHFSTSSNSVKTSKDAADAPHVMAKFRTIETVEKAALDPPHQRRPPASTAQTVPRHPAGSDRQHGVLLLLSVPVDSSATNSNEDNAAHSITTTISLIRKVASHVLVSILDFVIPREVDLALRTRVATEDRLEVFLIELDPPAVNALRARRGHIRRQQRLLLVGLASEGVLTSRDFLLGLRVPSKPQHTQQRPRRHAEENRGEQHQEERRTLENGRVNRVPRHHIQHQRKRNGASQAGEPDDDHVRERDLLLFRAPQVRQRAQRERVERSGQQARAEVGEDEPPVPDERVAVGEDAEPQIQVDEVLGQERHGREQLLEGEGAGLGDVVHVVVPDEDAAEEHGQQSAELEQVGGQVARVAAQQDDGHLVDGVLPQRRVRVAQEVGGRVADGAGQRHGAHADAEQPEDHEGGHLHVHVRVAALHEPLEEREDDDGHGVVQDALPEDEVKEQRRGPALLEDQQRGAEALAEVAPVHNTFDQHRDQHERKGHDAVHGQELLHQRLVADVHEHHGQHDGREDGHEHVIAVQAAAGRRVAVHVARLAQHVREEERGRGRREHGRVRPERADAVRAHDQLHRGLAQPPHEHLGDGRELELAVRDLVARHAAARGCAHALGTRQRLERVVHGDERADDAQRHEREAQPDARLHEGVGQPEAARADHVVERHGQRHGRAVGLHGHVAAVPFPAEAARQQCSARGRNETRDQTDSLEQRLANGLVSIARALLRGETCGVDNSRFARSADLWASSSLAGKLLQPRSSTTAARSIQTLLKAAMDTLNTPKFIDRAAPAARALTQEESPTRSNEPADDLLPAQNSKQVDQGLYSEHTTPATSRPLKAATG
ncbi:hypothetical protein ON010_g13053 [Phytophthora cinnamomi]|nr:hypothetical protein ON010_g13053 [Phytophthora cinnamomi]